MARNAPSRSLGVKARSSKSILLLRARSRTAAVAFSATTRICAPVSSRPSILPSATLPAPTTSTGRPSSLTNMGNMLLIPFILPARAARAPATGLLPPPPPIRQPETRAVPGHDAGQKTGAGFPRLTAFQVAAQPALHRIRKLAGGATVANRTGRRLVQTDRTPKAEVVGVHHSPIQLDLLALNPDVSDPMLPATVRTPGDMQFEVLIEARQAFFQFLDQPAREALGFRDRQLAEFRPAASNGSTPEGGSAHPQPDCVQFFGQWLGIGAGHVDDQQILHIGGAQLAGSKAVGQISGCTDLLRADSASQDRRSHVVIVRLFL